MTDNYGLWFSGSPPKELFILANLEWSIYLLSIRLLLFFVFVVVNMSDFYFVKDFPVVFICGHMDTC